MAIPRGTSSCPLFPRFNLEFEKFHVCLKEALRQNFVNAVESVVTSATAKSVRYEAAVL